ncbi:MAG: T9SS type A sorting domain-containing protein [Saprospiraceae bacterium]|nr:T9SS type A sorting domain-containing protein [Saprospiraceae bacterium]
MKLISTLILTLIASFLIGQTIITNIVQPATGDSFYYKIDTASTGILLGNTGGNQSWDFSLLSSNINSSEVYRKSSEGSNSAAFPTADAVVIQGLTENYYKFYTNRIELLGTATRAGGLPIPGVGGANVFPNPVVTQKYPENYTDPLSYSVVNSINIPIAIIPDSILALLPLKPDSIRINFDTKFSKVADAWGTLKLPAKTWNVLREKRQTESTSTLDAFISKPFPIGWIDVTALASGIFTGFFGTTKTTSFAFVSNETKGLIASVNLDTLGNPTTVQFKPDDKVFVITENEFAINQIKIYPNPSKHEINIASINLDPGSYTLVVTDVYGKEIVRSNRFISNVANLKLDISNFLNGAYYMKLINNKGAEKASQAFVKF